MEGGLFLSAFHRQGMMMMIKGKSLLKIFLLFTAAVVASSFLAAVKRRRRTCRRKPLLKLGFIPPQNAQFHSNLPFCCLLLLHMNDGAEYWIQRFKSGLSAVKDELKFAWHNSIHTRERVSFHFCSAYNAIPRADLVCTAVGTLSVAWLARRCLRRYKNANDLPLQFFEKQKKLSGLAVTVNDSDNIRFYHQPNWLMSLFFPPNLARQDLKYHTINVRLAGIDAPEMAHFGTKSQPYAAEAKEWLTNFVQGRRVRIQLLRIDQYGRVVAMVWVRRRKFPYWLWPVWWNVSLEMVSAGFATLYRDAGAEYGGIKKKLVDAEARAKRHRLGMWKQSASEYQSPGDYKRLNRLNAALNTLRSNGLIAQAEDDPSLSKIINHNSNKSNNNSNGNGNSNNSSYKRKPATIDFISQKQQRAFGR